MKEMITQTVGEDELMHSVLSNALREYHDTLNSRRRMYQDALDFLLDNDPQHRDIPMLSESLEEVNEMYGKMFDLLIAVGFGSVVITYEENEEIL